MEMTQLFYRFGVALLIGLLIGLERQFRKSDESQQYQFGGVRTFSLLALVGCAGAMLADIAGTPWGLVLPLAMAGGLLLIAYQGTVKGGGFGMTTEVAAVLTIVIGALCYHGQLVLATALGVATFSLLSMKLQLHRISTGLTDTEIVSLAKFGLMTAIMLPVLPNTPVGDAPFDVVTLRNVWLMVVLVAAIGLVGYILKKLLGHKKAILLTGFLGGLVSSTAVTLTYAARSKVRPALSRAFATAVIIAWTTMFIRVIVEVAVVNPALVKHLWIPMAAAAGAGGIYCLLLRQKQVQQEAGGEDVEVERPFSLKKALTFGFLYAGVLVIARVAQMYFGNEGIYVSAVAAGFTDVDAITLSMAELSQAGGSVDQGVAVRAITLAAVSNTLVKAGIVMVAGDQTLRKAVLPGVMLIVIAALGSAYLTT
jgi:uncharacterized membrane protein (DUF4010 family)